ncbi:21191_t:CDS:2, partial [Cetraspora pellucida]
ERPVSPTSSEEDFNLKSRNIGEWLKSQAKEPPRPSSPIKNFVNKNIVDPIFKRSHERNSSTSSLPKIPSSLKNEINLGDDKEEFKLQNHLERHIRRKLFQESKKEEIISEDEKKMNELDNIIEDDVNDYYEN